MSEHGHIKFWQEIGRRNVLRVAAVYVGFSWAVVHSGVVVGEALELPHWIMRFVSAVLMVGFPAVVAFAWVYEITPEGLKRTVEVEKDPSITHRTAKRLNIVFAVLVAVLIGLYGAERYLLPHERAESGHAAAESSGNAPAREGGVSIAILPFLNLSGDPNQEYFSDGMTEEITSALAKVKALQVVGRTSAFEFKGQNKDLHAIGQALRASYLLEGSVRKAGNRVRITAQLIRADNGTHIWTDSYDRELADIFATQDDIARSIAAALQAPLGLKAGETLVTNRAIDAETYQRYLEAKALFRLSNAKALSVLEPLVAHEPGYAPAWALLAQGYYRSVQQTEAYSKSDADELRKIVGTLMPKAEAAAQRALQLDANLADAYVALGVIQIARGDYTAASDSLLRALASAPNNPEALHYYSNVLASAGMLKEALKMKLALRAIEPLYPAFTDNTAIVLWMNGQADAAIALMNEIPPDKVLNGPAQFYASLGRYNEAADALLNDARRRDLEVLGEQAARFLRTGPAHINGAQDLPDLKRYEWVYLYLGAPDRFLLRDLPGEIGYAAALSRAFLWTPAMAPVRRTPRFKALIHSSGIFDYWRAKGWPDMCHPVGADDFECS